MFFFTHSIFFYRRLRIEGFDRWTREGGRVKGVVGGGGVGGVGGGGALPHSWLAFCKHLSWLQQCSSVKTMGFESTFESKVRLFRLCRTQILINSDYPWLKAFFSSFYWLQYQLMATYRYHQATVQIQKKKIWCEKDYKKLFHNK